MPYTGFALSTALEQLFAEGYHNSLLPREPLVAGYQVAERILPLKNMKQFAALHAYAALLI